ncbi:hypothetical protein BC826DRAFT_250847 [Russula brevipes]|nr:hypothetical protein BC826DRAFT_250847 [Russula brevipes]
MKSEGGACKERGLVRVRGSAGLVLWCPKGYTKNEKGTQKIRMWRAGRRKHGQQMSVTFSENRRHEQLFVRVGAIIFGANYGRSACSRSPIDQDTHRSALCFFFLAGLQDNNLLSRVEGPERGDGGRGTVLGNSTRVLITVKAISCHSPITSGHHGLCAVAGVKGKTPVPTTCSHSACVQYRQHRR